MSEPEKIIVRYKSEKETYHDQNSWSFAVLDYCNSYLAEKWLNCTSEDEEIAKQKSPYYQAKDGSIISLTYVPDLYGIVVEIADDEEVKAYWSK